MHMLFTLITALFIQSAFSAPEPDFEIVDLPLKEAFYRDLPKGKVNLATEMKTFLKSAETYKIVNNDEWIVLIVDGDSEGQVVGLALELETRWAKNVPANRKKMIAGGKFIKTTMKKEITPAEFEKKLKKFMADNKLKPRGKLIYILVPIKKKENEKRDSQSFKPVE